MLPIQMREAPLRDYRQTGRAMRRISREYWHDLGGLMGLTLGEIYDFVRKIPYQMDPPGTEILARPAHLLDKSLFTGLDCKKKAIILGSYFEGNDLKNRLIAVSETPDKIPHHVYNQIHLGGAWRNVDATYPEFQLFGEKDRVTFFESI